MDEINFRKWIQMKLTSNSVNKLIYYVGIERCMMHFSFFDANILY